MTFTLHVDGARWRAHTGRVLAGTPGLVPVVKGNGYGFGCGLLAAEAARLGVDVVAVGQADEIGAVRSAYAGDVLVLTPLDPRVPSTAPAGSDDTVIWTVATMGGLKAAAGRRVVVELLTSMLRFGFSDAELAAVAEQLPAARVEGYAVHLPLAGDPRARAAEVDSAIAKLAGAGLTQTSRRTTLWVSHLTEAELADASARHRGLDLRARIGTRLWLEDPAAVQARAAVLAVHPVRRGQRYGYWQRRATRSGHLVVAGAGTSHGIALTAPTPAVGLGQRVKTAGTGGLEALGQALSPFRVAGRRRWFAEPPHMQVSMIWLPEGVGAPSVGSELDVDVRMTTATFDRVVVSA